jgi:hypothetical protein
LSGDFDDVRDLSTLRLGSRMLHHESDIVKRQNFRT